MSKNTKNVTENLVENVSRETFDFSTDLSVKTENRGQLGDVAVWTRAYTDSKGESRICTITDKTLVATACRMETLIAMKDFASIGMCYELAVFAENREKLGFRSLKELAESLFPNIKANTATQYARVGKYFVKAEETVKGRKYSFIDEVKGTTVTNLVQILSLVDDKAENPLENLFNLIADDKIHLGGTLPSVKKEVKALSDKTDEVNAIDVTETAKEVSSIKKSIADNLSELLTAVESLDEEKQKEAVECIRKLEELFNECNK